MKTPEQIKPFASSYNTNAWEQYTIEELGNWVHLLAKRAGHRTDKNKREKDLLDARNYLSMISSHLDYLESKA